MDNILDPTINGCYFCKATVGSHDISLTNYVSMQHKCVQ